MVAPGYLEKLYKDLLEDDKKPFTDLPPSPHHQATPSQATPTTPSTVLTLPPHSLHDSSHSCSTCTDHTHSSPALLSQSVPTSHDSHMTIRWCIPASQRKYCVIDEERETLITLSLPHLPEKPDENLFDDIPIFTPSIGRASTALLNLAHSGVDNLHVIVTTTSEMTSYVGAWPGHVIMGLPDNETLGRGMYYTVIILIGAHLPLGMLFCRLKQFLQFNYDNSSPTATAPLPWVLLMADSCVLWKSLEK